MGDIKVVLLGDDYVIQFDFLIRSFFVINKALD